MTVAHGAPLNLKLTGLCKSFGGAQALSDVNLEVRPGEILGLLGENGSGKSTLIKILAGFHAPDAGHLEIGGVPCELPLAPGQFRKLGMQFVHQDLGLVHSLSVLENLVIGELATQHALRRISWKAERCRAAEVLEKYNVDVRPTSRVDSLAPVEQALVAIVRAVEDMGRVRSAHLRGAGVLFLDEPTAFLPKEQVDRLFALIRQVVGTGASVVFVSHDLDEVRAITHRITVLRNGRNVGTVETKEASIDDLVNLIVGRALTDEVHRGPSQRGTASALSVRNLRGRRLRGATLNVRAGEVLGVTGLLGSGFEDVPYLLFGAEPGTAEALTVFDADLRLVELTPRQALDRGIALIPGDRQRDGSVGSLSATENLMLLVLDRYVHAGALRWRKLRDDAGSLMESFDIRPRCPELVYSSFSGGNQQKAVLAKWLQAKPRVLLLHEPTQGVDVGARLTILTLIREAAAEGTAVLCASSDYEQLAQLCDRVLVIANGEVAWELTGAQLTKEHITAQCLVNATVPAAAVPAWQQ